MHDHQPVILNANQLATLKQFDEALRKAKNNVEAYGGSYAQYEMMLKKVGEIHGSAVEEMQRTGNIKICPDCLRAMPIVLRELADIMEELAKALELPEAKAKTKFGV